MPKAFSVRIPTEMHQTIRIIADIRKISINSIIKAAFQRYIHEALADQEFRNLLNERIKKDKIMLGKEL